MESSWSSEESPKSEKVGCITPTSPPSRVRGLRIILGVALGHAAVRLGVARDRPPLEPRRVQPPEDPRPSLDEWLDLEVVLPDRPIPQVGRQPGDEEIGWLEDVAVGRNDEFFLRHGDDLLRCDAMPRARTSKTARA